MSGFDLAMVSAGLRRVAIAWDPHFIPRCDSTQELARSAVEAGAGSGWLTITDFQRRGRGRQEVTQRKRGECKESDQAAGRSQDPPPGRAPDASHTSMIGISAAPVKARRTSHGRRRIDLIGPPDDRCKDSPKARASWR